MIIESMRYPYWVSRRRPTPCSWSCLVSPRLTVVQYWFLVGTVRSGVTSSSSSLRSDSLPADLLSSAECPDGLQARQCKIVALCGWTRAEHISVPLMSLAEVGITATELCKAPTLEVPSRVWYWVELRTPFFHVSPSFSRREELLHARPQQLLKL